MQATCVQCIHTISNETKTLSIRENRKGNGRKMKGRTGEREREKNKAQTNSNLTNNIISTYHIMGLSLLRYTHSYRVYAYACSMCSWYGITANDREQNYIYFIPFRMAEFISNIIRPSIYYTEHSGI